MSRHSSGTAQVALLIPYLGTLPPWIDGYLALCARNPKFHWIIFSDDPSAAQKSQANVDIVVTDKKTLEELFSSRLGCTVRLDSGYKLCDYRPAFGQLFAEYLEDYAFWGHIDLDLVLGDLDKFFSDEILNSADAFSCSLFQTGHLSIFRNTKEINTLYLRAGDSLEHIFSSEEYLGFDEQGFELVLREAEEQGLLRRLNRVICAVDTSCTNWRIRYTKNVADLPEGLLWYNGDCQWREGKVLHKETMQEVAYFHFNHWKEDMPFRSIPASPLCNFTISELGFVPEPGSEQRPPGITLVFSAVKFKVLRNCEILWANARILLGRFRAYVMSTQ